MTDKARRETVLRYHERTKHHPNRYARSPGYLDWETQPSPFRLYRGAPRLPLTQPADSDSPDYDSIFLHDARDATPPGLDAVGRLFFDSLSLSAWKQSSGNRWSLRVNPSSGNLHPTEAYLLSPALDGGPASPGLYHYSPLLHALEHRADLPVDFWNRLPGGSLRPIFLVGLSSIPWRESWKYGERAFRYCQHDIGHAAAAVAIAAAALGWRALLVDPAPSGRLAELMGIADQNGPERELAECLIAIFPGSFPEPAGMDRFDLPDPERIRSLGEPNRLSEGHRAWPAIDEVAWATEAGLEDRFPVFVPSGTRPELRRRPARLTVREVVRRRRSAVAMDGVTHLDRDVFFGILERTLARDATPPNSLLPWQPTVSLVCMVHRVRDLSPGLYIFPRHSGQTALLRSALDSSFDWTRESDWPEHLPLYRLAGGDFRSRARLIACHQEIAADGAVSVAMLARFGAALDDWGPWAYRRLFWESGLVGQILYLEAEAAGVSGTGIGCFFDDVTHELLGLRDRSLQCLYQFTIGGRVEDPRLQSLPAYSHLASDPDGSLA